MLTIGVAHGAIVTTTGNLWVLASPPASVAQEADEHDTLTRVFLEQSLVLGSPLTVDNTLTGNYPSNGSPGATIAAGTPILSYYLDFDPIGAAVRLSAGSITFGTDILGVIFTDSRLGLTNPTLKSPTTSYTPSTTPGIELGAGYPDDQFSISANRRTLSFTFRASSGQDQMRVIVSAIPEPSSVVLSLLGFGALAALRRSRQRT